MQIFDFRGVPRAAPEAERSLNENCLRLRKDAHLVAFKSDPPRLHARAGYGRALPSPPLVLRDVPRTT